MSARRRCLIAVAVALGAAAWAPRLASAAVERHAIVIGNDRGAPQEPTLRWAETDARKVYDVLKSLGGFAPENMVLLQGESPDVVRGALIATNDRIRSSAGLSDREVVLVVYYSGHADAEALHLGAERLAVRELEQLVRGSSAAFRLLVVDACRSGALTQVKGAGARAPAFPIVVDQRLPGEGAVFWSSSAANEDAQESDEIRGSFFTHYLVSGLLGAADEDGDGNVVVEEAYRYAYQNTLRASSQTLAGLQHPTYRNEVRGRGGLALTRIGGARGRATLTFPAGTGYLLFEGTRDGPVTGELGVHDAVRRLSLRPGTYFVRGRGAGYLVEGTISLGAGETRALDEGGFERLEYARLTRKGAGPETLGGALGALWLRAPLAAGEDPCAGALVGWAWVTARLTLSPRVQACAARSPGDAVRTTSSELAAALRVAHAWDLGRVALDVAVMGGAGVRHQSYETRGRAPSRTTAVGIVGAGGGATFALPRGFYAFAEAGAGTDLFERKDSATGAVELATPFVWSAALGVGRAR